MEEAGALGLAGAREQNVMLRLELDPECDRVLVDRVQIQQVLVNLFRNALEAMAESPKRELASFQHESFRRHGRIVDIGYWPWLQ